MDKKELFKEFLKNNKDLSKLVIDGKTTYQKLFETYDIYGEDDSVWSKIRESEKNKIFEYLKNIDMDKLEDNVSSIEKALSFFEEILSLREDKKEENFKKRSKANTIERFFDD